MPTAFKLHVVPAQGKPFEILFEQDSLIIGRSRSSDLVIDDLAISRRHSRLYRKGKLLMIEDLNSHNGTMLNGKMIALPTRLEPGNVIKLCSSYISIRRADTSSPISATIREAFGKKTLFKSASEMLDSSNTGEPLPLSDDQTLRHYADRLRLLNEVHLALARPMNRDDLLRLILDRVFKYLHPEEGTILLFNEDGSLTPSASHSLPGRQGKSLYSRSLAREVTEKGMAALVYDVENDERFSASVSILNAGIRSLVAAPIMDSEGILGMIVLDSRAAVRQFLEEDMALLVSLASAAALRLRNLALAEEKARRLLDSNRLLEKKVAERTSELQARNRELETLDNIVKTLNREMVLQDVLQTLLQQGLVLFPQAEKGAFLIWDHHHNWFKFAASTGDDFDSLRKVVLSREDMLKRYTERAERIEHGVYLIRDFQKADKPKIVHSAEPPKSVLSMALILDNVLHGLLILDNFSDTNAFDDSDMHKLNRFREHAVLAVAKARYLQGLQDKNDEILRTQDQLILQEKMVSLGILTAGVAHEIKNPLNFVNNFALLSLELFQELRDELKSHRDEPEKKGFDKMEQILDDLEQNAEFINLHGKRADAIVHRMMMLTQGETGTPQEVDLNDLVEDYGKLAFRGLQSRVDEARIRLVTRFDPKVGNLAVVPQNLSRALINLINNAIEALVEKYRLTDQIFEPRVWLETQDRGEWVEIRVKDNGRGIPPADRPQVFNPFFTTKLTGKGNIGLGLSISYDIIVKEHHGDIQVNSEEGEFTEFVLKLPRT